MKVIIIDDELYARKLLRAILKDFCPQVEVLAECEDLPTGVKAIRKLKPNLVFLDIEMPGLSGLELLDFFNAEEVDFGIIFTTAYNQYALKAFKLSAIDYLLKPIDSKELVEAVMRYERTQQTKQKEDTKPNATLSIQKISVPVGQTIKFIDVESIVALKAENTYTEIYLSDGKKLLAGRSLKSFEDLFKDDIAFFRCHKSYIIHAKHIVDYVKSDGGYLVLTAKCEVPISREKTDELLAMMANFVK